MALVLLARWLVRRKREAKVTLLDPDLFRHPNFTAGVTGQMLQQVTLGGAMIALPLFFQMTLEYNALEAGLSLAPLSLTMFAAALVAGRRAGDRRPAAIIRAGFLLASLGIAVIIPFVPRVDSGWYLVVPLAITGCGLGLLVSQLNNYTLAPGRGGAGQRGRRRELGGRVLRALLRSGHGRWAHARRPVVQLHPHDREQRGHPAGRAAADRRRPRGRRRGHEQHPARRSRSPASRPRSRPRSWPSTTTPATCSLQIALLVPLLAGLLGLVNSFRMLRLPDQKPSASLEGMDFG